MSYLSDDEIINTFRRVDIQRWDIQLGYQCVIRKLGLNGDDKLHRDYVKRLVHHALERQTRTEIHTHLDLLRIWKDIRPTWKRRKDGTYEMTPPKMKSFRASWEIH